MSEILNSPEARRRKPYRGIVIMPYSSGEYRGGRKSKIDPKFGLTYESKMSTLAGLQAYKEGKSDKIILVGEDTVGSDGKHSTVDFMKELLMSKGVPENAIEIYPKMQNSVEQLGKISEIQKPDDEFLIVSLDFHMPRVQIIAKNQNIKGEHPTAEDLLRKRSPLYMKPIKNWQGDPGIEKAKKIEVVLRPLNRIDTKGHIQKFLTWVMGTRKPLTDFPKKPKKK